MAELYFQMRNWWSGFTSPMPVPGTPIRALAESEIVRQPDGTPSNLQSTHIIFEMAETEFDRETQLQARIFSRVASNPGLIAPVLDVLAQYETRLKGQPHMFRLQNGGALMRYVSTRLLPLPAEETRMGWVCGLMRYSLKNFRT